MDISVNKEMILNDKSLILGMCLKWWCLLIFAIL